MREGWFWQPDQAWVNEINTTNLRTINGIRMGLAIVAGGLIAFGFAVARALTTDELVGSQRATDLALGVFDTLALFVGAVMGISVAGAAVKRFSDLGYVEKKHEGRAKVAEAQAKAMKPPIVGQAENVEVKNGSPTERVAEGEEHEWASGDPKAGVL